MMKIECPECKRSFIWTDDMSMTGKCPSSGCDWRYDVREQLKSNVDKKILAAQNAILCPTCGKPISSRLTLCKNCGRLVVGKRSFEKKKIFMVVVFVLLFISLIVRLYNIF
ncbi:MAG: hypothetical protein JXA41_07770 [Deltaproteobacteria bacterium]|nr:hypothetical protein [Deltaproteobacteria bacterium]